MKIKTTNIVILLLISFTLAGVFMTFFYYQKLTRIQEDLDVAKKQNIEALIKNNELSQKSIPVKLEYNQSTGELFPMFNNDTEPHTCVWSIWGDHGSDSVVITRQGDMYNMDSYDYFGHLLSDNIEIIKVNKFLPPRVPIFVNCVDWQNVVYYGSIGEYK